jgi:hypothetical protein
MRKSKATYPDYQVADGGAEGLLYKPWQMLVLPEGGYVCLMHEIQDDLWMIFSLDHQGVAARTPAYRMKSVSQVMFRELCQELTKAAREALCEKLSEPGKLEGQEREEAFDELSRLETADDEMHEGSLEVNKQFCRTHTQEEIRKRCDQKWAEIQDNRKRWAEEDDGQI